MNINVSLQPDGYYFAYDMDNYDAEYAEGRWFSKSPVSYGKTKELAVSDLFESLSDETDGDDWPEADSQFGV